MSAPSNQIRIQLEGRLEVLESAIGRYEALTALLKGNWERRAIEERNAVVDFLAQEPSLEAALEHAQRVSVRDGWPADAEARQVWAKLAACRQSLQLRVAMPSWAEATRRLREVAESARLPGPDELVLLEGTAARALPLWALTLAPTLLAMTAWGGLAAGGVMVSMVCLGLAVLPLGKYVLLVDRLLWLPYRGVPVELPLTTVATDGVSLDKRNMGISIAGRKQLKLPVITSPVQLAALLLLYRTGPLKGVGRPPAGTVVILPGWVSRGGPDAQGLALIHSGGLCFLSKGTAPALLKRITSTTMELPISEAFLLEQLTRLPAEDLEPVLSQALGLPGCLCASPDAISADPIPHGGEKLRLRTGGALVEIPIGSVDYDALRTLFPWTEDLTRRVN